jgi:hypothetical protein
LIAQQTPPSSADQKMIHVHDISSYSLSHRPGDLRRAADLIAERRNHPRPLGDRLLRQPRRPLSALPINN